MQKSLELMNIKLHTVIRDITGKTGTGIIEAILAGERDPKKFVHLIDWRIKADHDTIVKSLEGNWREEHLFTLRSGYELLKFHKQCIENCDKQIEQYLIKYEASLHEGIVLSDEEVAASETGVVGKSVKKKNKNNPLVHVRKYLQRIHGVDVMNIYGVSEMIGLQILAETGNRLSKWENEKKFSAWLNLCPNNKITGRKVKSSQLMKRKPNLPCEAFRNAANAVQNSNHWLG